MKKLAIVSSYSELCGNATYTEALRKNFAKYYDVTVFPLRVKLLEKTDKYFSYLGDKHIDEIAQSLKEFDFVNIQFEAGLYGVVRYQIYRRLKKLVDSANNVIVTLHRYDQKTSYKSKQILKGLLCLEVRKAVVDFNMSVKQNYFFGLTAKLIRLFKSKNVALVVHTKRERELISVFFGYERIYDHPISFLTPEELKKYKLGSDRREIIQKYGLSNDDVLIGIFGFISKYKGHHVIVDAMKYLPDHYKLLIFGSQHPFSMQPFYNMDSYISDLIEKVSFYERETRKTGKKSFKDRILFCGALTDDEFIKALFMCDFNVLPYYETGQSGSGIASLTLETGCKAVFSQNYAFLELEKYAPGCFKKVGIGNYLELADSIRFFGEDFSENLNKYYEKYNINTSIDLYKKIFEKII